MRSLWQRRCLRIAPIFSKRSHQRRIRIPLQLIGLHDGRSCLMHPTHRHIGYAIIGSSVRSALSVHCVTKLPYRNMQDQKLEQAKNQIIRCSSHLWRLSLSQLVNAFDLKSHHNMYHPKSFSASLLTQEPPWPGFFRRNRQAHVREL